MPANRNPKPPNQLHLLKKKRFGPFFLTQFFGAFNDNVFKNALIILIAFQSSYAGSDASNNIINLAAILFILPFFLFSATAGQIADRFEKARLIRKIKLGEIGIMLFAAVGFYFDNIPLLLLALFLMGTQSSFFGPIKYSIIPQHLKKEELIGGNALVESGTFMAILLGTMAGGVLVGISSDSSMLVSYTVITLAGLGYVSSLKIPLTPAVDPLLKIRWNPFIETFRNLHSLRENRTVLYSILGIAWFWFLGATYITQLPNFTRLALGANAQVVTFFLALLCIGIGVGSLLCERLSHRTIELGLVPIGSIGLSLFGADIYFATAWHTPGELLNLQEFMQIKSNWRLSIDIFLTGVFSGIYIVPLYALIQARSDPQRRSRVIAGNNILNAIAIVAASVYAIVLLNTGLGIPQLFLIAAILNAVVALYIYTRIPEFFRRFILWILVHLIYRVKRVSLENIPEQGAALIVCNPANLMNALIITGCIRRPVRFVMHDKVSHSRFLHFMLDPENAIPVAPEKENPARFEKACQQIVSELHAGNAVGFLLEGNLTSDDKIGPLELDIEHILSQTPVAVVPVALGRIWGSYFNNRRRKPVQGLLRKLWPEIQIIAGKPVDPNLANTKMLQEAVTNLLTSHSS